ncbi:MAG TPA: hypothetical protein VHX37_02025 [Acidobacteriaceae bacterium]|jgi:hypothetical protein|nr:hypothetical protein [Acidobacteriaceae bacterium]
MIRKAIRFLGHVISGSSPEEDSYPSVVLLLIAPRAIAKEDALLCAARAWGGIENGLSIASGTHRGSWIIQVSAVLFGLRSGRSRWPEPVSEPSAARQRVWEQHRAWLAVDYAEGAHTPETEWPSCYKLLFLMVHQLWDENCCGLYLPAQKVTVPNVGDLISSIRWAARNGTPLEFLQETQA